MKNLIKNFKEGVSFSTVIEDSDFKLVLDEVLQKNFDFHFIPNTTDGRLSCFINCEHRDFEKFHLFYDNVKHKIYYFPSRIVVKPLKCHKTETNEYIIGLLHEDFEDYLNYKLNGYKIKVSHTYKLDRNSRRFVIKCDYEYITKLLEVPFISFIEPMGYAVLD